eukprot:7915476-Lingulodinium_polyedra.AAC.1
MSFVEWQSHNHGPGCALHGERACMGAWEASCGAVHGLALRIARGRASLVQRVGVRGAHCMASVQ